MQTFLTIDDEDEGGPAAQTGSVVHAGVAAFHKCQDKLEIRTQKGWEAIAKAMGEFPLAEEAEVKLFFKPYINDPRNIHANIPLWIDGELAIEKQIDFTLPPHEIDPTGAQIYIQGTFDQIRLDHNEPRLYDLKTGKKSLWEQIHDYAYQFAAYTYGIKRVVGSYKFKEDGDRARCLFFDRIKPGKIIRAMGYRARAVSAFNDSPDGVFIDLPYRNMRHCEWLLETVRLNVALYRMGHINFGPGYWCTYCPKGGLTGCIDEYEQLELKQSAST